ncbi:MAG TPA: hypothetical protein VFT74_00405 [Isosphaeraceae bacterium]|nr:hypothetical protein [Isosphaeraceae bacterium]
MRPFSRPRLALAASALGLIGLLAAWSSGRATPIPPSVVVPAVAYGGFGGGAAEESLPESGPVYIQSPVTEKAAQVWLKLQQPVEFPFANETPLEDLLKYVQSVTAEKDGETSSDDGILVYVDPVGLQEADKTMQSPIMMNLGPVPLSYGLRLALRQLDLAFHVEPEGVLFITYKDAMDRPGDPVPLLLDEVLAARREVHQLRQDVADLKALLIAKQPPPASK